MQGSPSRPLQGSPGRPPEEEQRAGDADDEIASLLSTSQQMVAVPPAYEDAEEEAEVAMMREGLAKSQQTDLRPSARSPAVFARKGSLFFSSAADLLGPAAAAIAPKIDEMELAEFTVLPPQKKPSVNDAECKSAKTVLMMPFSFWPTEDKESPAVLAKDLLQRELVLSRGGLAVPLWERTGLPKEAAELSLHFRQLLGYEAGEYSPVQRLRLSDRARALLFSEPKVWADTKTGDFAGKQCEWTDVHLVIFPHGAILSITVNWTLAGDPAPFMLSDLRTWLYVSKFRSIKIGVTRGWSFTQRALADSAPETAALVQDVLGLKLFAALYGGSCVSLGAIVNWLVKKSDEQTSAIPRRISRHDYCHHHTCALLVRPPPQGAFEEYLFHLRRANGNNKGGAMALDGGWKHPDLTDRVWAPRANALIASSREGLIGVEWGISKRTFLKQFVGIYCVLTLHCLSERVTLEKLSYLAALESQNLPAPGSNRSLAEKDVIRRKLMSLATLLVRYRSAMASDDCGGRSEFREYFQTLRQVFSVAALKDELREELQDTLAIVESDWMEEKRNEKNSELLWKLKKDEISKRKEDITTRQKRVFDIIYSAFSALGLPFILIANIWSMNNSDLPREVSWAYLMMGSGLMSIVLLFLVYIVLNRGRPELLALTREEQLLNAIRREKFEGTTVAEETLPAVKPATRRKLRLPQWPASLRRRSMKNVLQVEPLTVRRESDEMRELVEESEENIALNDYLNRLESGEPEEEKPFDGPSYLEPGYHREYSVDLVRPMPPSAVAGASARPPPTSSLVSKRWFSWLRPSVAAMPATRGSARVADGFADLEPEGQMVDDTIDYLEQPRRHYSLDIPRPPVPQQSTSQAVPKASFLGRFRGSTARSTSSSLAAIPAAKPPSITVPKVEEEIPLEEEESRGSIEYMLPPGRGFSLDLQRPMPQAKASAKSLFARNRSRTTKQPSAPPGRPSADSPPTLRTQMSRDDSDLPRRGVSLDISRNEL